MSRGPERERGDRWAELLEVHKDDLDTDVLRDLVGLMQASGSASTVPLTVGCEISDRNWHKEDRDVVEL